MKRVDPTGKRALFEAPVTAPPDHLRAGPPPEGRTALFSVGPRRAGTVIVGCSSCGTDSRIPLADLGVRLVTGSWWIPGRRHGHWLRCPACRHRAWCEINWLD